MAGLLASSPSLGVDVEEGGELVERNMPGQTVLDVVRFHCKRNRRRVLSGWCGHTATERLSSRSGRSDLLDYQRAA